MNILMILREDFPPDERVAQEASRLARRGHRVGLVCFNRAKRAREEVVESIDVFRLCAGPFFTRKMKTLLNNLPYMNPFWYSFIMGKASEFHADALHVHDLPLVRTVLRVGRKLDLPVVFDMHENWPELLPSVPRRAIEKLLATRKTFKAVEAEVCREVDAIVVVVEESRDRLIAMGVGEEKVLVVPNVADLERMPRVGREASDDLSFIYAGGISRHRGLDNLVQAWASFAPDFPQARLTIAGKGPEFERIRRLIERLGLGNSVELSGWLDFPTYVERISRASVGLVPHASTPHTDTTLPHKLFHYMAMGKAVLVGDALPLRRIVEQERCGLIVRSGDIEGMAGALRVLASDPLERAEMGERGRKAVLERYNWDKGIVPLLDLYDALAGSP